MDIVEKLTNAIKTLDQLDEYKESLPNRLSEVDSRLSDLLHYIENNNLNTSQRYRIVGEIQKQRKIRREIKEDFELLNVYTNNLNRLNNIDNRKFVLAETHKAKNKLSKKYSNRVYTEEELKELVG